MADSDNESGGHNNSGGAISSDLLSPREQDRLLPIANVSRIMKRALPANAKISKDAKETVQECVSEFISFITGEASDKCQREKRKTINGDDLLWAMTTLGFEEYAEPLKLYLQKFRELEGDKGVSSTQPQQQKEEFAVGGMMMMGQQMYGSYHPRHHNMVGKGGMAGGGGNSSSSAGIGRQGRG